MNQFSSIAILYKSPSKCIKDKILLPIRKISAEVIRDPKSILKYNSELQSLYEICIDSLKSSITYSLEKIKEEITF